MPPRKKAQEVADVLVVTTGRMRAAIIGLGPFVFNAVSYKAKQTLLWPEAKGKTQADYAGRGPKHDPMQEYHDSVFMRRDDGPTKLIVPRSMVKDAITTAALDMQGVNKSRIQRLTWVEPLEIDFWGVPRIYLAPVRNSDPNRTLDIRTRAAVIDWACEFTVCYAMPMIKPMWIPRLIRAGGMYCGLGDGRQETGYGNGQFELVQADDKRLLALKKTCGKAAQEKALVAPEYHDVETARLLGWYFDKKAQETRAAEEVRKAEASFPNGRKRGRRVGRSEGIEASHAE